MRDTFRYIIDNYGERAGTKLDPQDGLHSLMSSQAVDQLIKLAKISTSDYIVEGSVGKGLYAYVPWLAVRSRDESVAKSITQGYYVVYLFRADMSGFYLSLMQGWNYFYTKHNERVAPARAEVQSVSDHWRRELSSDISQFDVARIDLRRNHRTPRGYEASHICGKFYPAADIPSDEALAADLSALLRIYSKLGKKLGSAAFSKYNDSVVHIKTASNSHAPKTSRLL